MIIEKNYRCPRSLIYRDQALFVFPPRLGLSCAIKSVQSAMLASNFGFSRIDLRGRIMQGLPLPRNAVHPSAALPTPNSATASSHNCLGRIIWIASTYHGQTSFILFNYIFAVGVRTGLYRFIKFNFQNF